MFVLIRVLFTVLICLFLNSSPLLASSGKSKDTAAVSTVSGKIIDYGIVRSEGEKEYNIPGTKGEKSIILEEPQISETTTKIPMKKGTRFGFKWQMLGVPTDQPLEITYRYKHPPMVEPDGKKTESYDRPVTIQPENGKFESFDGYELSEDYELVPGNWTMSILYNDKVLVSKTFQVVGGKK
jgi:hypothetical protein